MANVQTKLNLPSHILTDIVNMHNNGQNSLIISKILEQKYSSELSNLNIPIPTYSQLDRYLKSVNVNTSVTKTQDIPTPVFNTLGDDLAPSTPAYKLSEHDSYLKKSINLSSVKDTNQDLKKRIADTILRMESQRVSYPETFTDKDEDRLQRYYDMLSKHNLAEIKVSDALKDKDILDTQTVVFFINKLFSSLKLCVDKYVKSTEDRNRFFLELKTILSATNDTHVHTLLDKLNQ